MKYSLEAVRPSSSTQIPLLPRVLMTLLTMAFTFSGIGVFILAAGGATIIRSEVISHRNKKQRNIARQSI